MRDAEERAKAKAEAEALSDDDLKAAIAKAQQAHRAKQEAGRKERDRSKVMALQAEASDLWSRAQMLNRIKAERARDYQKRYKARAKVAATGMIEPLAAVDIVIDLGPSSRAVVRAHFAKLVMEAMPPEPYDDGWLGYKTGIVEDAIDRLVTQAIDAALAEGDLRRVRGRDMQKELGLRLGRVNSNEWCLYTDRQLEEKKNAHVRREERRAAEQAAWEALKPSVAQYPDIHHKDGTVEMSIATLVAILEGAQQ